MLRLPVAILLAIAAPGPVAAQLLDPGWDDPAFAAYRGRLEAAPPADQARAEAAFTAAEPNAAVAFTLPVLGLPAAEADAAAAFAAPVPPLSASVPDWPGCAAPAPTVTTSPDRAGLLPELPAGSWYVRTLDFGCLEVTIEGDRNTPDAAFAADAAELPESGTVDLTYADENAGEVVDDAGIAAAFGETNGERSRGVPTVRVVLGQLAYTMSVVCLTPDTTSFCNNSEAMRTLARQLAVVGGAPQ